MTTSKTFYVTEYVISRGIIQVTGEISNNGEGKMLIAKWKGGGNGVAYFHKPDWHENLDDAKARATTMIEAKIKSLTKSLAKVEALRDGVKVAMHD